MPWWGYMLVVISGLIIGSFFWIPLWEDVTDSKKHDK